MFLARYDEGYRPAWALPQRVGDVRSIWDGGGIAKTVYGVLVEAVGEGEEDGVLGWFSFGRCRLTSAVVRPRPPSLISSQAWRRRVSRST